MKEISGFKGYYVTTNGRVWSDKSKRYLKPSVKPEGYCYYTMVSDNGAKQKRYAHRLVAAAFVGPCPDGHQVNHKNGDKTDNSVENLEYVTAGDNLRHARRTGLNQSYGSSHGQSKLTEVTAGQIKELLAGDKMTQTAIAQKFGVCNQTVSNIKHGRIWRHV